MAPIPIELLRAQSKGADKIFILLQMGLPTGCHLKIWGQLPPDTPLRYLWLALTEGYRGHVPFFFLNLLKSVPTKLLKSPGNDLNLHWIYYTYQSSEVTRKVQTGKYVVRAEDLPRANNLPCAQRPIKRAKFDKYTCQAHRYLQKGTITYAEALRGTSF